MTHQTQTLWLAADIARELGISPALVANWAHYRKPYLPTPYATTPAGTRLWNDEQVKAVIAAHYERQTALKEAKERVQARKEAKERAERMVKILSA